MKIAISFWFLKLLGTPQTKKVTPFHTALYLIVFFFFSVHVETKPRNVKRVTH